MWNFILKLGNNLIIYALIALLIFGGIKYVNYSTKKIKDLKAEITKANKEIEKQKETVDSLVEFQKNYMQLKEKTETVIEKAKVKYTSKTKKGVKVEKKDENDNAYYVIDTDDL